MPESAKVNEEEEASSKTEEPGLGAKKALQEPAASSAGEGKTASARSGDVPQSEGGSDLQLEAPEEKNALALTGTAPVQIQGPVEHPQNRGLDTEKAGSSPETGSGPLDDLLSGRDGFDDVHDLSADEELADDEEQDQSFEDEAGHRTLSEIALTYGALHELEGSGDDLSSKHDELAEAVQAALESIYGEAAPADPGEKALTFSPEREIAGPGWSRQDNLSPQDVILNYFDYQPGQGRNHFSHYDPDEYGAPSVFDERDSYPSPQYFSQAQAALQEEDLPSYSESHLASVKGGDAGGRESSRLLGAAAIGLVGGIAVAASLAVFVITSYGPAVRQGPGPSQTADASQGYGRWAKGGADLETAKAAAAPSPLQGAPAIAASDVLVTSGQPSPLAIEVRPEQSNERSLISITGVPEGARLNAGVDAGGGNWLLPPRRLNGLTINVPPGTPQAVTLSVQVLDSNVRTPLSEKKQFAIRVNAAKIEPAAPPLIPRTQPDGAAPQRMPSESAPAAEPPKPSKPAPPGFSTETVEVPPSAAASQAGPAGPAAAQPSPASRQAALGEQQKVAAKAEIEDLIREGNKRMREGDILEARQLYQKAVALGDPEAALAMGRSYDPIYFARIDKKNAEPDAAKAFDWYRKAMDGGAAQAAKVRIENLKHFLNQ